jgi:hypothetical protein
MFTRLVSVGPGPKGHKNDASHEKGWEYSKLVTGEYNTKIAEMFPLLGIVGYWWV